MRPDLESSLQNTSDRAIFKRLVKSFIFGFIMGVNGGLFRPVPDGGCVKWKTTDAILFLHGRGMIKSLAHHALFKKYLERHTLMNNDCCKKRKKVDEKWEGHQ